MTEQLTHHHIVATHAGDKLALYVDGVLAGEQDSFLATIEHWHPCTAAAEVVRLQTQLTEAEASLAAVRDTAEQWRNVTPSGFYPEASAHANAIENCGDELIDLLADFAAAEQPEPTQAAVAE